MKITVMFGVAVISFSGFIAIAQQTAAGTQTNATVDAGNMHGSQTTDTNATASANRNDAFASGDAHSSAQAQMHPVNGELVGKLDSKTAKSGDTVVVKTSEAFRTSEGIVVPKGSRLIGHVTEVRAHGNGYQDSRLGIEFDRAELKSGRNVAMQTVIESVAPPANAMAAASMDSGEDISTMGSGRALGGGRSGGGVLGGASSATSATGGVGSSLGHTVGSSVGATSGLAGNSGATLGNGLNGAAGATLGNGLNGGAQPRRPQRRSRRNRLAWCSCHRDSRRDARRRCHNLDLRSSLCVETQPPPRLGHADDVGSRRRARASRRVLASHSPLSPLSERAIFRNHNGVAAAMSRRQRGIADCVSPGGNNWSYAVAWVSKVHHDSRIIWCERIVSRALLNNDFDLAAQFLVSLFNLKRVVFEPRVRGCPHKHGEAARWLLASGRD